MPIIFRLPVFGIVLFLLVPLFLQAKIWTSSDGRTLEAELVEYKDGVAQLKRPDGRTITIKKEQLSQADQDFLENLSSVKHDPLPLGAKMEVHAISVAKKMPPGEKGQMMWGGMDQEGTRVTLLVQVPDYSIMALDEEASKLTRFSDDKNTDLLKTAPKTGGMAGNLSWDMMGSIEPTLPPIRARMTESTGKWVLIDCSTPNLPASQTQTIALEGELVLQCGQGAKTSEHKSIPLDGSGKFTAGGVTVTVQKAAEGGGFGGMGQETKMRIAFVSNKSLDGVISYTFFDAQENEIEWQDGGSMWGGNTHTEYFNLAEEVDSLTIQLEEYEKIETITLPVSLKVGLGL